MREQKFYQDKLRTNHAQDMKGNPERVNRKKKEKVEAVYLLRTENDQALKGTTDLRSSIDVY